MSKDRLNEVELKVLMELLLSGKSLPMPEWTKAYYEAGGDDDNTRLRDRDLIDMDYDRERVYITDKGVRAVEEASCQMTD
jgi:hypothetical protein